MNYTLPDQVVIGDSGSKSDILNNKVLITVGALALVWFLLRRKKRV